MQGSLRHSHVLPTRQEKPHFFKVMQANWVIGPPGHHPFSEDRSNLYLCRTSRRPQGHLSSD